MSSEVVVRLRGVDKSFPAFKSPRDRLVHMLFPAAHGHDEFHALRGIDLDIRRGEAIGILGRNGSGKSTLLQVIAGIMHPSAGEVRVGARVAALLELGAGFNPEFTGRENIHLNASLLGLDARQIAERMDRIIAFAEIGSHVEQQVKTYSSGMFMRLAFAVAVHTDPEVLIVDEALSVGDIYFQRKCFKRIEEMRQQGCTLLFVTHSIDSVLQLCERGVVLEGGRLVFDGDAQAAVKQYLRTVFGDNATPGGRTAGAGDAAGAGDDAAASGGVAGTSGPGVPDAPASDPRDALARADAESGEAERLELEAFLSAGGRDLLPTRPGYNRDEARVGDGRALTADCLVIGPHGHGPLVRAREPLALLVRYHFPQALDRLIFGLRVCTVSGAVVYSANTLVSSGELHAAEAGTVAVVRFDLRCSLLRNHYFVTFGVSRLDEDGKEIVAIDRRIDALILAVSGAREHAEGVADMEATFTIEGREGAIVAMR